MTQGLDVERPAQGVAWRLGASAMMGILWLTFLIVWLFFFASEYNIYQNLAIVILSIVLSMGAILAIWISFGLRFARHAESIEFDWKEQREKWWGWRGTASMVVWAVWFGLLIAWLFFFAGEYDAYQNVAVIIITLVFAGGISALLWSPFGGH